MEKDWQIWLNVNNTDNNIIIGKNAYYKGDKKYIYSDGNITIIGYGKIYNEIGLGKLIGKNKEAIPKSQHQHRHRHTLQIIVDLYLYFQNMHPQKYNIENILELIEGDFSFVLLDFNLLGEESWIYIARDIFGLYPLYFYEHPKKVQFDMEIKQYCFSSLPYIENRDLTPFLSGNYQIFSHSFKVSATWKQIIESKPFYKLPFYSTVFEPSMEDNMRENAYYTHAIDKRLKYIKEREEKTDSKKKIGCISFDRMFEDDDFERILLYPKDFGFTINEQSFLQVQYVENEYPSIITRLRILLNSNDPGVIRSYFIPSIIAKYISEHIPDMKHVFVGENFTKNWIEKSYLERNICISQKYLDENIKGWTSVFISYGIELYMPYLDRILLQSIPPKTLI